MSKMLSSKFATVFLTVIFISLVAACIPLLNDFLDHFSHVIYPFTFAIGMGYIVYQLSKAVSKRLRIKSIGISTVIVIAIILAYVTLIVLVVIPTLSGTFSILVDQFFILLEELNNWLSSLGIHFAGLINWEEVKTWLSNNSDTILSSAGSFISSAIDFIANVVIWFFMFLLVIFDFKTFGQFWGKYWNRSSAGKWSNYFQNVNEKMRNISTAYIKIVLINSVVLTIVFTVIGLPGALSLGLLGGILALIPYFGPFMLGILAVLVGFSISTPTAILALAVMSIWPIIDGNIIQPKILSEAFKVKPAIVLLTIMTLMILCGPFLGIIFAYPTTIFISAGYEAWQRKFNII